jgi:hypothetical protein
VAILGSDCIHLNPDCGSLREAAEELRRSV